MPDPDIRSVILSVIADQAPTSAVSANLQSGSVLQEVERRLGRGGLDQAILTQWHELFRTGYLAWGLNLANPNPPFFHLTDQGRGMLSRLSRDPGNPAGYLAYISSICTLNPVATSYLNEGIKCFTNDLFKASAVMLGAAAESVLLELRDTLTAKISALGQTQPKGLSDWRIKTVLTAMEAYFESKKSQMDNPLKEEYEAHWSPFNQVIRVSRNDAGHPKSVDPISFADAHAAFLIFPEQIKLANRLATWVGSLT